MARQRVLNWEKDGMIRNDRYQRKDCMDLVENAAICERVHVCMCML